MDENATVHRARSVQNLFAEHQSDLQHLPCPPHSLDQGWRTYGTQHKILGTPPIKKVCILVQNNKVHYEVLRSNTSDWSWCGGKHIRLLFSCLSYVVDNNC
ncbi:hypothetical protein TNCV_5080771 [Trichonephila clavipes]|nr:hypothetical protein TNCV_5080771 [Trichonephila clavipes]